MRYVIRCLMICIVLSTLAGCSKPQSTAEFVLTYASPYPSSHPFSRADISWMKFVEQRSRGRLHIKPFWGGSLLSADQSVIEIRHGVADIGLITPIYMRGGMHASRAQAGFYGGVQTMQEQIDVLKCLFREFPVFDRELEGLHVLALQGGNFPGVLTRSHRVRTLEDLRGLRLRSQSETIDVLRRLGADPVDMPMGEVYSAMAKGVIDGVVAPPDALRAVHLAEVGSFFTELRVARGSYPARAMSKRVWDRLPLELQQILTEGQLVWESALVAEIQRGTDVGYEFARERGVEIIEIAASEQAQFDRVAEESARARAASLSRYGIDGVAILDRAQQLIRASRAGQQLDCTNGSPGGPST